VRGDGLGLRAAAIGAGATLVLDTAGLAIKKLSGVPPLDYRLVGRWVGHFPKGTFRHQNIRTATPVRGEAALGWAAHYTIGIAFAGLLLTVSGVDWAEHPTPAPALVVGVGTVAAPWFVMQPAFGMGWAASRTPNPGAARLRSLRTHAIYGLGLYLSGLAVSRFSN